MPIWAGLSPVVPNRFGVSGVKELVNLTSDHTIVHNVYVDYDNQSTHSKLHRPSFICNDVINDVIKRREIRRPPERKELSPQVLKHRQRWLARINRIHRPFLTDRRPLRQSMNWWLSITLWSLVTITLEYYLLVLIKTLENRPNK